MKDYDIGEAFQRIEEEMISSMSRNLQRHLITETEEDLNYPMWQAEQLAAINEFKQNNKKMFSGTFSAINAQVEDVLKRANASGKMEQEAKILEAIQKGWRTVRPGNGLQASFFKINERKMKALISATTKDLKKAEYAMLRRADDIYRKTVFNAQVFYNSGAGTLPQCVDMATKDFLSRGIDCIEYSNGARVGIDAYSRMSLRTAETRAYLQGESTKRDEWGINTVIVNKRGAACPKCLQWVGKVYYDDVYCSTPVKDDKYPLLSTAIAGGLYHPNCKDIHTTYFEGVSTKPQPITQKQADEANRVYALEQRQRYNERMIRKYKRLADGSVDEKNKEKYAERAKEWEAIQRDSAHQNSDVVHMRRDSRCDAGENREKTIAIPEKGAIIRHDTNKVRPYTLSDCALEIKDIAKPTGRRTQTQDVIKATVFTAPDGTRFMFQNEMDVNHQRMTPETAIELWQRVPQNIRDKSQKAVIFVDYYNPMDAHWRKKYKNFRHSYATGGNEITFYRYDRDHDSSYVVRTFCHESGHYIDRTSGAGSSVSDSQDWKAATLADLNVSGKKSPTAYGENSSAEDFAESVAEFAQDPDFKTKYPNRWKILERILR